MGLEGKRGKGWDQRGSIGGRDRTRGEAMEGMGPEKKQGKGWVRTRGGGRGRNGTKG